MSPRVSHDWPHMICLASYPPRECGIATFTQDLATAIPGRWSFIAMDELAAEVMGMPTRRLKLMAFAIGAAIAALAGTVSAAWQGSVTPGRYDLLTLINLYAMIVLGGIGSLPGVVLGAFIFTALPEALRSVQLAGVLFYGGIFIGLVWWLKPSRRLLYFLVGLIGGGFLFRLAVNQFFPGFNAGLPEFHGTILNQLAQAWLVIPAETELIGNVSIGVAVLLLFATLLLMGRAKRGEPRRGDPMGSPSGKGRHTGGRHVGLPLQWLPPYWITLGVTIYLLTFAWETRLAEQPSVTRVLVVGVTLIVLMISRPHGLLGKPRVSVV